jgi:oligoribonuclease
MAMSNDCDHNLLVWIDLEMSGLDLNIHTIVEIAIAITDFQLKNYIEGLKEISKRFDLLNSFILGPDIVIHHDQDVLDKMNDWSRKQHTKSGLIQLIQQSQISLIEAETTIMDFLKQYCTSGTGILAGNSVFVDRW